MDLILHIWNQQNSLIVFIKGNRMCKVEILLSPSRTASSQHRYIKVWCAASHAAGRCLWRWSAHTAAGTAGRRTPPADQRTPGHSSPLRPVEADDGETKVVEKNITDKSADIQSQMGECVHTSSSSTHRVQTRWGPCTPLWRPGSADWF